MDRVESKDLSQESADRLRDDIGTTRCEMDETLDALSQRLKPSRLARDAFNAMVGESLSAEQMRYWTACGAKMMFRQMRRHPVPSMLFTAGLAYLAYEQRRRPSVYNPDPSYGGSYVDARTGRPYDETYGQEFRGQIPQGAAETYPEAEHRGMTDRARETAEQARERMREAGYRAAEAGHRVRERASELSSRAAEKVRSAGWWTRQRLRSAKYGLSETAAQARHGVASTASTAAHKVQEGASRLGHTVACSAASAGEQLQHGARAMTHQLGHGYEVTRDKTIEAVDRYPLAAGAAALSLGVLVGLMMPRTRSEDRWIGERADRLREQARQRGRELYERGKDVARETVHKVAEAAEHEGLTPAALAEKAKHVARETGHAAAEAARREGLSGEQLRDKAQRLACEAKETAQEEWQDQEPQPGV